MSIAQKLYEQGLITYMRTDSTNLSGLAINSAKKFIVENFGEEYSKVRQYKTKSKGAQEAHEAIRPTYMENTSILAAYVSTNSICQGESVPTFWKRMVDYGTEIQFAHQTFRWDSEARDMAAVHCVIVGFSHGSRSNKKLRCSRCGYCKTRWHFRILSC